MKVILVDPTRRRIGRVETDGGLEAWYRLIDCRLVEFMSFVVDGVSFDVICDEEGSFKADENGEVFATRFNDDPKIILGKFLIVGVDLESGETINTPEQVTAEFVIKHARTGKIKTTL